MTFTIRPFAADFAAITPLVNALNPDPTTPEQLAEAHSRFPAEGLRNRLVAVADEAGVVGYANVGRWPSAPATEFYLTLITAPPYRRRGIGSALLGAAADWARAHGCTRLLGGAADDDERALTFGRKHGFQVFAEQRAGRLEVAAFDEAPFAGLVEQVQRSGIAFFAYPDQPEAAEKRRLYELYKVTDLDTPGYAGTDPARYPPFESWHDEIFGQGEKVPPGCLIVARDGDRLVGLNILQVKGIEGGLYTEYTGVLQAYRGRKIAQALKLLSIKAAQERRAPYLTTRNDSRNGPMLAINAKLGFVRTQGRSWLERML